VNELFLAVDGGQSATIAVLATTDGTIIGVGRGGPIRRRGEHGADEAARDAARTAVGGALRGLDGRMVVAACLALTGSEESVARVVRELVPAADVFVLRNDALAALAAARYGEGGIGLIAGTGTVAVATGRDGGFARVGGHGWLLGDEGGAYWIGIQAIRAAVRAEDGTGPATVLSVRLPARLAQPSLRDIADAVTGQALDRVTIGRLAPEVVAAADAGDRVAAAIIDDAVRHLVQLVTGAAAAAPFLQPDEQIVVGSGGVLAPGGRVARALTAQLERDAPDLALVLPDVPPVIGALYLGFRRRGVPIDPPVRARLREQVPVLEIDRKHLSGAPA
jgi:N-acetylglucosamine kinase-like BadF-type ATPase